VEPHQSAATWHKSSHSSGNNGCIEHSRDLAPGAQAVRDTKQRGQGPVLIISSDQWRAFVNSVVT
jgi:hypothetical protein